MNFITFREALSLLTCIPDSQCKRALQIAEHLSDDERDEFHRYLREMDEDFAATEEAERAQLEDMETAVGELEKNVTKLEREEQEGAEREEGMESIEEQISTQT